MAQGSEPRRLNQTGTERLYMAATTGGRMPVVPAITLYVILVWFLWGFFMAIGWVLGSWIANQLIGGVWRTSSPRRSP